MKQPSWQQITDQLTKRTKTWATRTGIGGIADTSSYFDQNRHSMYTEQVRCSSVPGWCSHCWCRYHHHTLLCHSDHVKNTSKLDRLKSRSKRDTNETPTCSVFVKHILLLIKGSWPTRVRFLHSLAVLFIIMPSGFRFQKIILIKLCRVEIMTFSFLLFHGDRFFNF